MKSKLLLIVTFLFLSLILPISIQAAVIINEFSVNGSTDWVELFNTDANNNIDLSTYTIQQLGAPIALSGTLPKNGLLTFTWTDNPLSDTSGTINLLNNGGGVDSITYGVAADCETPGSGQSAYLTSDGVKTSCSKGTPTKGWFNSTTYAPSQANLATLISNGGAIITNFGTIPDLSRAENLYYEKPGYGKITFTATLNMTDSSVVTWMQTLSTKLEMNTKGTVGLDAETVADLKNAGAQLVMYGLTLNDPTISVTKTDGSADNSGAVSGLSYDKTLGTLTFTAAHFTTFTASEKSTSSSESSGGSTTPKTCSDVAPSNSPVLFQIDTLGKDATLFFTPANDHVSYYRIAYGYTIGDDRFGIAFNHGLYSGVINYTVGELALGSTYYFRVRGGNGCSTGNWSNWLKATPFSTKRSFYLYP
ncbi:MAG: hypothetical protein Q7R95_01680 [bacterium]|nr:hypothetical protein [bacterium]